MIRYDVIWYDIMYHIMWYDRLVDYVVESKILIFASHGLLPVRLRYFFAYVLLFISTVTWKLYSQLIFRSTKIILTLNFLFIFLYYSCTLYFFLSFSLSLSLFLFFSVSLSLSLCLTLSVSLTHSLFLSLSRSLSFFISYLSLSQKFANAVELPSKMTGYVFLVIQFYAQFFSSFNFRLILYLFCFLPSWQPFSSLLFSPFEFGCDVLLFN